MQEENTKQKELKSDDYKLGLYDEMLEKLDSDSIYELLSENDIKAIIRLIDNLEKASKYDKLKSFCQLGGNQNE